MKECYVYIMSNQSRILYTGVTTDLQQRVLQHKLKLIDGFTSKYNLTMLVWYEVFPDINQAIESEKTIKAWRRSKKIAIIEQLNPRWEDLAENWYPNESC